MIGTRYLIVSCAIALCAVGCGSEEPSATEATEPEVASTTGAEQLPAPEPEAAPAPEEPPPAAAVAEPPAMEPPKASVIVMHKVKDFDAWKTAFDADEPNRKAAGIMGHALMTDTAKPGMVGIWLPTNDLAKVEEFAKSPELKKAMKDAGVVGAPTMMYLNHVAMSPPSANGAMPKYGAIIEHKVKDFDAWKTGFDADEPARKEAGITGYAVSQDPKDPKHVTVWLEADTKEALSAMLASKELAAKMKEAGVIGKPKTTIVENGEMKMYQ